MTTTPVDTLPPSVPEAQRGLALFVSLVFLVILTLLGLMAMTMTSLEAMMASSSQDRDVALQAAESALRQGETYVSTQVNPGFPFSSACTNGLCTPSITTTPAWAWTAGPVAWGTAGTTQQVAIPVSGVSIQPEYIVELLPNVPPVNGSLVVGKSYTAPTGTAYRITAVGWGARVATHVMVQTVFIKN